ncbi:F-box/LRR-repeat protein At2g43260-like [Apium graveolens]|uniref:F-box/LRR-repeat protein At2g43260-like n=1 Tax=Apium graveolens TaxID=4045 RepID=UPI003D791366
MSKKSSVEIGDFEFEIDDLEYLMKQKFNMKIMEKEEHAALPAEIASDDSKYLTLKGKVNETIEDEEHDVLLPEIIPEILLKLPADYLYKELRLICKDWKSIISSKNFILEHFAGTKPVFLVQRKPRNLISGCRRSYCMEINEKQLDCKIQEYEFNCLSQLKSSCYGILLIKSWKSSKLLQVLNLMTRSCLTLPKCPSGCPHRNCGSALAFDPCTNRFKVVHMYADNFGFEIFTIGDSCNAWKRIPGPWKDLSQRPADLKLGWSDPVLINGRFLYWNVCSFRYIVSMDVSDEKCIRVELPRTGQIFRPDSYHLLELGAQLSFMCASNRRIDIWILQDFHTKLWFKKHTIDPRIIMTSSVNPLPSFRQLFPLAGTRNGVLVFKHTDDDKRIYIYDTERKRMQKFITKIKVKRLIVHKSSLFKLQQ